MRKLSMQELGRRSVPEFSESPKRRIVLILDNIRSGLNTGSIFRTADAFAIEKIVLSGITPRPPHREIEKTALGATDSVQWEYNPEPTSAVRSLMDQGYRVWPVEQTDKSRLLDTINFRNENPIAFILGNEVSGISDAVIAMLEESVEIPQSGTKHSLNVAVAAGIVLWHAIYG